MNITKRKFDVLEGRDIFAYSIKNSNGVELECINYGCIITKLTSPDFNGNLENVVLGFDNIGDYLEYSPYFGAVVGRVAGRIGGSSFTLDGETYILPQNEGNNHLHGGPQGFNNKVWDAEETASGVKFTYVSPDGEEGYPGMVTVTVLYELSDQNELTITYQAMTDQKTVLNLTNHSYFNLSGDLKEDVLNHKLTMKSSRFLELGDDLLPTGNVVEAAGTPFDFKEGRKIVDGVNSEHPQNLLAGGGYDHPFLLDENNAGEIFLVDETSGRTLTVETTEPGVVLYTGNQLEESFSIRGVQSRPYLGLCLETQKLPDPFKHPHFPSIVLDKDQQYNSVTKYKFGIVE
ncbi:galactose-1-epimerase [Bacillus lacus]|uniref:Aldose 1-epimerase n=1 Tax=Metabacillus lacus TaxID=1983721 RepID=A0A7X2LZ41_9BACI|nr:aldose epimerase family protein [Metabacillus lacus]MRX72473.1 galactose-1-epimerase [Metabacillus lacus]